MSHSPTTSTQQATRCSNCAAPRGHVAVLARAYQPDLAATRGVLATTYQDGHLLVNELAEKPDPRAARALERRHGVANLFLFEGWVRVTAAFISSALSRQSPAGAEPKLALAIADWARTHPVIVTPTTSQVIDLGTSQHCGCVGHASEDFDADNDPLAPPGA